MAAFDEDERVRREKLCKQLGLGNTLKAYELIAAGARGPIENLTLKGLNPSLLRRLGYTEAALRKLGYSDIKLQAIGFAIDEDALPKFGGELNRPYGELHLRGVTARQVSADGETLRGLVASGARAEQLVARGYNAEVCKKAGFRAAELYALGFDLGQLKAAYPLPELKRAGLSVMSLKPHFQGREFRHNGFSASEMRAGGFRPRELLNFGYREEDIATAGFSAEEMRDAGLTRLVVDRRGPS